MGNEAPSSVALEISWQMWFGFGFVYMTIRLPAFGKDITQLRQYQIFG
jgi:hypothetical protein